MGTVAGVHALLVSDEPPKFLGAGSYQQGQTGYALLNVKKELLLKLRLTPNLPYLPLVILIWKLDKVDEAKLSKEFLKAEDIRLGKDLDIKKYRVNPKEILEEGALKLYSKKK